MRIRNQTELLAFRAGENLVSKLRDTAMAENQSVSVVIRKAVEKYVDKKNKSVVSSTKNQHNAFAVAN